MSNYSMADIVSITGIKSHTLRKWESRYNFIEPKRTATNIRFYTDEQLRKLLNISILTRNGYRISKINSLSDVEISEIVSKILLEASPIDDIVALVVCMLEMNEIEFNRIMEKHTSKYGLLKTVTDLLYPFLNHIGVLWITNKAMPAQEHFISNLIRQKLMSGIDALPLNPINSPTLLLFLMEGERHEIGLLLANFVAKELGWRTYYLGANVPVDDIKDVLAIVKPKLMFTIFTMLKPPNIEKQVSSILKDSKVELAIAGNTNSTSFLEYNKNLVYLKNSDEFIELLRGANFFNTSNKSMG